MTQPTTVVLFTRIDLALDKALRKQAYKLREHKSHIVRQALHEYFERRKGEGK